MTQYKENALLIIVLIVCGLKKSEDGVQVVCNWLKVAKYSKAKFLTSFQNNPPTPVTAKEPGHLPQLTESVTKEPVFN